MVSRLETIVRVQALFDDAIEGKGHFMNDFMILPFVNVFQM